MLTRDEQRFKQLVDAEWSKLAYEGLWIDPFKDDLEAFIGKTQGRVSGTVRLKLYKGNVTVTGRKSPQSLYSSALVTFEDFYREGHRRIFQAISDLFQVGEPIEPITVIEQLTKSGDLDLAGGRDAVLDLMSTPYIAASYRAYAEIVRDTATQRRLLQIGQEIETLEIGRAHV